MMSKKKSKEKKEIEKEEVEKEIKKEVIEEKIVKKEEIQPKKSLKERLLGRKQLPEKTFLECLKKHNSDSKFDYNRYICGTGGNGILCDALGAFNPNDRKLFQEVLQELKKDETLYHIGGCMYVLN